MFFSFRWVGVNRMSLSVTVFGLHGVVCLAQLEMCGLRMSLKRFVVEGFPNQGLVLHTCLPYTASYIICQCMCVVGGLCLGCLHAAGVLLCSKQLTPQLP